MNDNEQQTIIDTGRHAADLLTNPAFEEAFDVTLERVFAAFMATSPEENTERDACWATCQALRELRSTIDAFIANGEMELKNREYDRKQSSD